MPNSEPINVPLTMIRFGEDGGYRYITHLDDPDESYSDIENYDGKWAGPLEPPV